MTQMIASAPLWVWPLLAVLLIVGLRARRSRTVPAGLVYALPLLGLMTLRTVAALPAGGWIWAIFVLANGADAWGGYLLQRGWILGHEGRRVQLAGEWLTLTVMMVIFWANFAGGFLRAVTPAVYGGAIFMIVFASLLAASGGSFAGPALWFWRAQA